MTLLSCHHVAQKFVYKYGQYSTSIKLLNTFSTPLMHKSNKNGRLKAVMKWKSQQQLQRIKRWRLVASPIDNHEAH